MTREEKALEASKRFARSLTDSDLASLTRDDIQFAFQLGIKWADDNPVSDNKHIVTTTCYKHCIPYNDVTKPLSIINSGRIST